MLPRAERFHVDIYLDQGESSYTVAHPFTCQVLSDPSPTQLENTLVTILTQIIPITNEYCEYLGLLSRHRIYFRTVWMMIYKELKIVPADMPPSRRKAAF